MPLLGRRRPEEPLPSFEEIASSLRSASADAPTLLNQLAQKLEGELGSYHVRVSPSGRKASVREITVDFGGPALTLSYEERAGLTAKVGQRAAGQWVSEKLSVLEWLEQVHLLANEHAQIQEQAVSSLRDGVERQLGVTDTRPALVAVDNASAVAHRSRPLQATSFHPEIGSGHEPDLDR